MAEQPLIYKAINEAMAACGAVGKDENNKQQNYRYRSIDAVMNALNPALRKAKVFASPEVLESTREERHTKTGGLLIYSIAKVKYTFFAEDGSNVSAIVIGEGMDSGDKSFNKAMSAAYKYALFQVFCIPTEEMIDSEQDSPDPAAKTQQLTDKERLIRYWNKMSPQAQQAVLDGYKIANINDLTPGMVDHWSNCLKAKNIAY